MLIVLFSESLIERNMSCGIRPQVTGYPLINAVGAEVDQFLTRAKERCSEFMQYLHAI